MLEARTLVESRVATQRSICMLPRRPPGDDCHRCCHTGGAINIDYEKGGQTKHFTINMTIVVDDGIGSLGTKNRIYLLPGLQVIRICKRDERRRADCIINEPNEPKVCVCVRYYWTEALRGK